MTESDVRRALVAAAKWVADQMGEARPDDERGIAAVTSANTNGVTGGDEIWWCERHQCRWGYAPDCGWSPSGEVCRGSRRLLIRVGG